MKQGDIVRFKNGYDETCTGEIVETFEDGTAYVDGGDYDGFSGTYKETELEHVQNRKEQRQR